jgi:hypothetical protein
MLEIRCLVTAAVPWHQVQASARFQILKIIKNLCAYAFMCSDFTQIRNRFRRKQSMTTTCVEFQLQVPVPGRHCHHSTFAEQVRVLFKEKFVSHQKLELPKD